MIAMTFDTLKYVERMEVAGMPREQAKANAEALAGILETNSKELTTQNDIRTLQGELRADMRTIEERFNGKMNALEERVNGRFTLLQWMIGFSLALNVAIFFKLMT